MPTYDFQCAECGAVFEVFRHLDELNKKVQCPNCSSERTRRLFSTPHIEGETVDGSGYGRKTTEGSPRTGRGLGRGMGRMA